MLPSSSSKWSKIPIACPSLLDLQALVCDSHPVMRVRDDLHGHTQIAAFLQSNPIQKA